MDPFIIGSLIGAGTSLLGGLFGQTSQNRTNTQNVAATERMNEKNLAHAEKWNQINHSLARETLGAQLAQQEFVNDQYIESRDYDRALQQEVFNREDTAIQRAMQDATSAGFSPLAALGVPAGAGQVVGSSSAPGSMVSNNQAAVQSAGQVAPSIEAATGLSSGLSSVGSMIATMAESMSMKTHQKDMQTADILASYKRLGMENVYDWLLQDDQQDFLNDQRNAQHLDNLATIAETARFESALEELRQKGQQSLQDDAQSHELQMQTNQQNYEADYRVKTASAAYEDSLALGKEILLPVVRHFSPDLADWMEENSYGSDILVQIVRSVESTAPLIEGIGDAAASVSPVRQLSPFK